MNSEPLDWQSRALTTRTLRTYMHCIILYCIILYCIELIHFYSASHSLSLSEELPTTATDTVSEFTAKALQAAVSERLAQGPYMAARAGHVVIEHV